MSSNEKKDMNVLLSELLAKAKEKEGLDLVLLRDEIRKEIESGDKTLGKFLELVESFQDVLPKEKQRYNVAIRALSTTSGLSRQNILESTVNQLEELKKVEKMVLSALPGFRDELKVMESRSQEIKGEVAKLREKIAQFEREEQEVLVGMAAREREMKIVGEAVSKLFTDIGAEISGIRKKIEEFTGEKVSPQPMAPPDSIESHTHEEEKGGTEEKGQTEETLGPQETDFLRKCPMCGGLINFLIKEAMWMCYTCGYEESVKDETEDVSADAAASEPVFTAEPSPSAMPAIVAEPAVAPEDELIPIASATAAAPLASSPSVKKPAPGKKSCPACRRQMDWREKEKSWQCPFCDYRRVSF